MLLSKFNFRPTFVSACKAAFNIMAIFSIFAFLASSAQEFLFAIKTVFVSIKTSTIRRLFARSELPVSVKSTMASTNSGTLTSVAPHENSTSADTPCSVRKFLVTSTSSVAIVLPSKSFTVFMGEFSGTAKTHFEIRLEARL